MKSPDLAIFGIPLSNVSLDEAIEQSIHLIHERKQEKIHHLINVKSDIITELYGWGYTSIKNPSLLQIYRKADLSITSQHMIVRLCKWLGSDIKGPIPVKDFISELCQSLGLRQKGIFFLGKSEKLSKSAAIAIHDASSGLRLVGIASPPIYIEGENLINAQERDLLLVEQINASSADVLIVSLESPKQEIWFERVRKQLKVPLVITIGDIAYKFADELMVPKWMSSFKRNPGHVFKLSVKFLWMAIPLVFYHTLNRFVYRLLYSRKKKTDFFRKNQLFLSPHRAIAIIPLPPLIDASNVMSLKSSFEEVSDHDVMVFDFRCVRHIQLEGFRLLMDVWHQRKEGNKEVYGFAPTHDVECLMKFHRVWDFFKDSMYSTAQILIDQLMEGNKHEAFYHAIYQQGMLVIISLFGSLDHAIDFDNYLQSLTPIIGQKNCALDLSFCTFVDSTGFAFLLALQKQLKQQSRHLILCSLSPDVRQQFRLAGVEKLIPIVKAVEELSPGNI